ncbi:MAG: alpha/beta fold hydrolase [Agathobacter sp.]|nr:alpha/beta fold hydrolase [Agathobacter sp.]
MSKEKKTLTKAEKNVIKIMTIVTVCALSIFAWQMYANDYYHAESVARKAMQGSNVIEVTEKEDYYVFSTRVTSSYRGPEHGNGIIFYPGGKVEETAYAPMLLELAEQGYEVYLVKMPAKLAIFGMDAAADIIEEATHIKEWTMMGHSLGGAMAASFSAGHDEEVDRLVLLAAYSTEDLKDKEIEVFSFYGTEDKVLNMEKYEEYYSNLPEDVIEEVIEGGNHANYAHYGAQEGDGEATITREEQQECVLDILFHAQ